MRRRTSSGTPGNNNPDTVTVPPLYGAATRRLKTKHDTETRREADRWRLRGRDGGPEKKHEKQTPEV